MAAQRSRYGGVGARVDTGQSLRRIMEQYEGGGPNARKCQRNEFFFRIKPQFELLQLYYPEFVGSAACINVPPLFVHLWRVLSPWMSPSIRSSSKEHDGTNRGITSDKVWKFLGFRV